MSVGLELSVVIPTHDAGDALLEQLDALDQSTAAREVEILVVDNASTDGTSERVRRWSRDHRVAVRVVPAAGRVGEAYARNVGWRAAASEKVAFCDADDVVGEGWVEAMTRALADHDYATGPVDTHRLNDPALADVRGRRLFSEPATFAGLVPYAHGCNMGFRKDLLEALGGFDESMSIGPDIEIAIRAWRQGAELFWEPRALVHYRLRPTLRETYRQGRSYGRARRRLRALVPELQDAESEPWSTYARRVGWLVKHLPGLRNKAVRARWVWVASQLDGELRSHLTRRP